MDQSSARIPELIRDIPDTNEDERWGAAFALARIGLTAVADLIVRLITGTVSYACGGRMGTRPDR